MIKSSTCRHSNKVTAIRWIDAEPGTGSSHFKVNGQGHPRTMAPTAKDSCTRSYSSTILEVHMGNLFFAIHRTRKQILHNCRNGVRNLGSSGGQYSSCLLLHAVDEFRNVSFITSVAIQPFSFKIPVSKYSWEVSVYNYRLSKYNVDQHGYAFPELV